MLAAPVAEAGPARVLAALGAAQELVAARVMEHRMGLVGRPTAPGGRAPPGARPSWPPQRVSREPSLSPTAAAELRCCAGLALLTGSALQRYGVFAAGVQTTKDPRYVVVPQQERLSGRTVGDPALGTIDR